MSVALLTGGSAGLGRALAHALATEGWRVIVDARDGDRLATSIAHPDVVAIPGDVTDAEHRRALVAAIQVAAGLDLLVHNASTLGPSSNWLPLLADVSAEDVRQVWDTNVGAPVALTASLLPTLIRSQGTLLTISSDAAVEHYPGWGLYGASKTALDHTTLTFGAENPAITAYAVDPGDMRTQMQQDAFPDEDISDRPLPETVVPHLLALLRSGLPSGRYKAADIPVPERVGR